MPHLTNLADIARSSGLPVIEHARWKQHGHGPLPGRVEVIVGHHTGTPARAQGDYPSLRIVTEGRSDLPGPLCNLGLGRSGTVYIIAAGVAWHAGKSQHAGFTELNTKSIGIEAEHPGAGPWPDAQLDAYPRLVAALCEGYGLDPSRYVSHRDCALPAGRKPDPAGITDDWMRAAVARLMRHEGDDMALTPDEHEALIAIRHQLAGSPRRGEWPGWPPWDGGSDRTLTLLDYVRQADVQLTEVRAALARLDAPAAGPAQLTEADVIRIAEAAVEAFLARMSR